MSNNKTVKRKQIIVDPLHKKINKSQNSQGMKESNMLDLDHGTSGSAGNTIQRIIKAKWTLCHYNMLPKWLQDNEFLVKGHRPPLPSFRECFESMFQIHTETVNIWTHLIGCLVFICIALYLLINPTLQIQLQEKVVFGIFLGGAIICLGFSFAFHTVMCHSPTVYKIFSKLDYCGISLLIIGSAVVWLYYAFYCNIHLKIVYIIIICVLGVVTTVISLFDRFAEPAWRSFRAGIFAIFGLCAVAPAIHYGFVDGWFNIVTLKFIGWFSFMGLLYLTGALLYATRVPERFFPNKFDIWLHSHQILHVCVIGGALVHLYGVAKLATHKVIVEQCDY